jgi:glycine cleavage system H protein
MAPNELRYTDQHEWVKVDGNTATIGITDHAQDALGDVTFVELPPAGKKVAKGDEACAIESAKAAAGIYAPADGTISGANAALADDPGLVNSDCYGEGWIYKMTLSDPSQLDGLMSAADYEKLLSEQD